MDSITTLLRQYPIWNMEMKFLIMRINQAQLEGAEIDNIKQHAAELQAEVLVLVESLVIKEVMASESVV